MGGRGQAAQSNLASITSTSTSTSTQICSHFGSSFLAAAGGGLEAEVDYVATLLELALGRGLLAQSDIL